MRGLESMLRLRRSIPTVLVIVLLTITPLAIAGWSARGNYEPDTARDVSDHWMQLDATKGNTGNVVYFNGFIGQAGGQVITDVSPNVGTLRTQNGDSHWTIFTMLGAWRDCNGDGFVGLGDQALFEYRSDLLVGPYNTHVCPVDTGAAVSHNDGQWVREFVPIMWKPQTGDVNVYDINDNSSRSWYDFGLPESGPASTCWLYPHPRGTYHSTGGVLFTYDCLAGYQITDNFDAAVHALGHDELSFADHARDQYNSHSAANVRNPWGEESDPAVVRAWDCGQPPLVQQTTPREALPGGVTVNPQYVNVSAPNGDPLGSINPGGSAAGTANATASGTDRCTPRSDRSGNGNVGTAARAPYALEGDVAQSATKRAPQGNLNPTSAARGTDYCPATTNTTDPNVCEVRVSGTNTTADGQGVSYHPSDVYGPLLGESAPRDLGVRQGPTTYSAMVDGFWSEGVLWTGTWPLTTNGGVLAGARYTTYYAYVSPDAVTAYSLVLPNGGTTGAYGAESCGTHTSGVYNGWDCDATAWYKDANGNDIQPRSFVLGRDQSQPATTTCTASGTGSTSRGCVSYAAKPGSPFNLRDIDCWDDSNAPLRGLGITEETIANAVSSNATNPNNPAQLCVYPTS